MSRQVLGAIKSRTLRELLDTANEQAIGHEDIVSIDCREGIYTLFYYYDEEE